MKTLVLGATGLIGKNLLSELTARNHSVRAAARKPQAPSHPVEWVPFDWSDNSTYAHAFEGVDNVFLLTPVAPNVLELTERAVEAAIKAKVKKIVKLSSSGMDHASPMVFSQWHREAEKVIESSGLRYLFLRPNTFMQNFTSFYARTIKGANAIYLPAGDARVAYIDARDIAAVAAEVLSRDLEHAKAYDLSGDEALSHEEIAARLSTVLGRKISYVAVSESEARHAMQVAGVPAWLSHGLLDMYRLFREGGARHVYPTIKVLLNRPATRFEAFAESARDSL